VVFGRVDNGRREFKQGRQARRYNPKGPPDAAGDHKRGGIQEQGLREKRRVWGDIIQGPDIEYMFLQFPDIGRPDT